MPFIQRLGAFIPTCRNEAAHVGEVDKGMALGCRDEVRAQAIFREALLKAYGNRCAVCEVCHPDFLEAAHLTPWRVATEAQRVDVRNGLLLCRNHHLGFDRGWWQVRHDRGRLIVSTVVKGTIKSGLPGLRTDALRLPKRKEWWPKESWLVKQR